eukprot:5333451-Amphidinium_carterae.1
MAPMVDLCACRYLRIVMSRTRSYRGPGPGEGRAVYAIREVEVLSDDNIARNKALPCLVARKKPLKTPKISK